MPRSTAGKTKPGYSERFWARVEMAGPDDCWLWLGPIDRDGYGKAWRLHLHLGAHRIAYELMVGPIPPGLVIDHLCRVRNCVNPSHMEPVTWQENIRRGIKNPGPAMTHCKKGHEFTPENARISTSGKRVCRACARANSAAYQLRKRETAALRPSEGSGRG